MKIVRNTAKNGISKFEINCRNYHYNPEPKEKRMGILSKN